MKAKWFSLLVILFSWVIRAADSDLNWRYQLLEGSFLLDECLPCDHLSVNIPTRGSFMLRRTEVTPFATRYVIENASFQAGADYTFAGSGTYETSGDFVVHQTMTLTGDLQTPHGAVKASFTNDTGAITRRWPMLGVTLKQTNGTLASTITLTIAAAPLREIWFSAATNFTRAIKGLDNSVSDGDLLSTAGRIVKRNSDFQAHFPGPTYENMGLDAVDILPGAEIAFSTDTLGVLSDGDFAHARSGEIVRWQDFMTGILPTLPGDPGLDGLQVADTGGYYFSFKTNMPGVVTDPAMGHGDILFSGDATQLAGLFKSNADLLARFQPAVARDYGLDAFYIWPSGEIWFSTVENFSDTQLGTVSAGDLLSDAGYIVYRNADLTAALLPLGDPPTDFGLDAVTVISDATAAEGKSTLQASIDRANNGAIVSWKSQGRVFQLERARDVTGPWEAITPIVPELTYEDFDTISAQQRAFYRLHQW